MTGLIITFLVGVWIHIGMWIIYDHLNRRLSHIERKLDQLLDDEPNPYALAADMMTDPLNILSRKGGDDD